MSAANNSVIESNDDPQAEKYRQLFLGGLNRVITEEAIKQHFEQWGEIDSCVIMKCKETNKSRGFGFITYKTAEMLDDAQNNRPHKIDNREIDTKRATPLNQSKASRVSVKKMFVGGLKDDTAEDDIREVFDHFGKIEKLDMVKDKDTGKQKNFCFITFEDFDSVDKCVLRQRISVAGKSVEVKKAKERYGGIGIFHGGMRGRGGFDGEFNYGYHPANYGYPSYMGDCFNPYGYGWYGDWYQGYYDNGGYYGWNGNNFGYGYGYDGGPTPAGSVQKGAASYKNDLDRGDVSN